MRTFTLKLSGLTLCCAIAGTCPGSGDTALENIYTAPNEIVIKTEKNSASRTSLKFPAVIRKKGMSVCLKFDVYLKNGTSAGWSNYLGIALNGKQIGRYSGSGADRIIGKPPFMKTTLAGETEVGWWRYNRLLVLFSPGTNILDSRIISPLSGLYTYTLDISDLINYVEPGADDRVEKSDENTLTLVNNFMSTLGASEKLTCNMVIENLQIGCTPSDVIAAQTQTDGPIVKFNPAQTVASVKGENYSLEITRSGGMILKSGDDCYFLGAEYSYPGEKEMGFNRLSPVKQQDAAAWPVSVAKDKNDGVIITAADKNYTLRRTVSKTENGIKIRDTLTNISEADLGAIVKYYIVSDRPFKAVDCHTAGISGDDAVSRDNIAENPSVFIRGKNTGLGMLADDNALRLQMRVTRRGNKISVEDAHFGLRKGECHTFELSVYPVRANDYFEFVNLVRKERNYNHTIPGPFCFGANSVKGMDIKTQALGPWFEYVCDPGAKVLSRAEYKKDMLPKIAAAKKQNPEKTILAMLETNLVSVDKRDLKGSQILPKAEKAAGVYSLPLSKEQSDVLENSLYKDSVLRTADGRIYADTFYPPEPYINLKVQPAPGNSREKNMLDIIDFMIDDVGFDGVYMDQSEPCGVDKYTFDKWDGRTVDIDAGGNIARKYFDFALVGAPSRKLIIERALKKGKTAVMNGQARVSETNIPGAVRFVEMENDPLSADELLSSEKPPALSYQAKCHLSCSPVVLGLRPPKYSKEKKDHARILMRGIITGLRNGLLYYYYGYNIPLTGEGAGGYGPVNHMFPFTPVELNEGFLTGKERIITCVSGKYFWPGKEKPACFLFGETGLEKPNDFKITPKDNGWEIDVKLWDWNEIATVESLK